MTDQQNYTDPIDGARLRIASLPAGDLSVRTMTKSGGGITVEVPAEELLAMIDRAAARSMRDYLRETTDATGAEIEAESAWHGDPDEDDGTSLPRPVPEADSPEDVDEGTDVTVQMRESGRQIGEAVRAFTDAYREAMKR